MQHIDHILRSLCRSVVAFRVDLEGTLHDCDEHSVPSGCFLSRGSRAAMAQGAAMRVRAALANGLRMQDRRMAAIFGKHLNLGREAVDIYCLMCYQYWIACWLLLCDVDYFVCCLIIKLITIDYHLDYDIDYYCDYLLIIQFSIYRRLSYWLLFEYYIDYCLYWHVDGYLLYFWSLAITTLSIILSLVDLIHYTACYNITVFRIPCYFVFWIVFCAWISQFGFTLITYWLFWCLFRRSSIYSNMCFFFGTFGL